MDIKEQVGHITQDYLDWLWTMHLENDCYFADVQSLI